MTLRRFGVLLLELGCEIGGFMLFGLVTGLMKELDPPEFLRREEIGSFMLSSLGLASVSILGGSSTFGFSGDEVWLKA